jgi:hypothetical protein
VAYARATYVKESIWKRLGSLSLQGLPTGTSVAVKLRGTGTNATLYTDDTRATTASNPTTVDGNGNVGFYVDPGKYDYQFTVDDVLKTIPFLVLPTSEIVATSWLNADQSATVSAAITTALTLGSRALKLNGGAYTIPTGFAVGTRGLILEGAGDGRPADTGGTRLEFTGTGALIELGTDDGSAHDAGNYNGVQGLTLRNMSLAYTGAATTALANGQGSFGTGTYAIRDWRGGDVVLDHVTIENFAWGFWGIQSDVNDWRHVELIRNKVGAYVGPRSDQLTADHLYGYFNDTMLDFDRCYGAKVHDLVCAFNGSATTPPIKIRSEWTGTACKQITLIDPWFEGEGGIPSFDAFIEIGVGQASTSTNDEIHIIRPLVHAAVYTGGPTGEVRYLVKADRCQGLVIEDPGDNWINLNRLINFVGTSNVRARIKVRGFTDIEAFHTNSGTGTPVVALERFDAYSGLGTTQFGPLLRALRDDAMLGGTSGFAGTLNSRTALVVENSAAAGAALSILAPSTGLSAIFFGDAASETIGQIQYDHTTDQFNVFAGATNVLQVAAAGLTITDGKQIVVGSTGGLKIATAATQRLGFYNAAPVVQPAANADTSGATLADLETEVNQLKALLRSLGLMASA